MFLKLISEKKVKSFSVGIDIGDFQTYIDTRFNNIVAFYGMVLNKAGLLADSMLGIGLGIDIYDELKFHLSTFGIYNVKKKSKHIKKLGVCSGYFFDFK